MGIYDSVSPNFQRAKVVKNKLTVLCPLQCSHVCGEAGPSLLAEFTRPFISITMYFLDNMQHGHFFHIFKFLKIWVGIHTTRLRKLGIDPSAMIVVILSAEFAEKSDPEVRPTL